MSKAFLLAFVAVAGVAAAGVDYVNQTRRAGLSLGQMSPGDYVASVSGRYLDRKAQIAAVAERASLLSQPLTSHLPPAPEGWVRRDWHDGDQARLFALPRDVEPVKIEYSDAAGKTVTATIDAKARTRIVGSEFAVYERPDALVAITLRREGQAGGLGGFQQDAMKMINANINAMSQTTGFAVVKGVTFTEATSMFDESEAPRSFRVLDAKVGPEVTMEARTTGAEAEIKNLLATIDFDLLNRLNAAPAAGIGANAPAVSLDTPEAIAAAAEAQRLRDQMEGTLAEIRIMEASTTLMLNAGKLTAEAHAEQMADLAARRDAVIARAAAAEAEVTKAASVATGTPAPADATQTESPQTEAVAAAGSESSYGGFFGISGKLAGLFGGKADKPAEAGNEPVEVKVNNAKGGGFGGKCTTEGAFKRCTVGD